jgi:PAS domain S-box-containing protein
VEALKAENEELRAGLSKSKENETRLASLAYHSPIPWLVLDRSGVVRYMSSLAEMLLDIKPLSGIGQPFTRLIKRGDIVSFLSCLRDVLLRHRSAEIKVTARGTRRADFSLDLRISFVKHAQCFHVIVLDHHDRREAQAELSRVQIEYEALLDSIDAIVWEAEADEFRFIRVTKKAERLLGYSVDVWLNNPEFWHDRIFVDDRERVLNQVARGVSNRQDCVYEYRMIAADRSVVWLRDSIKVVQKHGKLRLLGISIDITEQKRAQQELKASQGQLEQRVRERTAELEGTVSELKSFSYTLSHDMRAPLRAMHGYSELIHEKWGEQLGPQGKGYLRSIQESANRLDALVQDVLKYSKLTSAPLELHPVDLERLLNSIIAEYPAFQPPKAEIEIKSPLPPVIGHEGFLTQCVSNLLSNAVKFVPPNTKPRVRVGATQVGSQVQVWFEDNGIGIAPADQRRIFRMFQRIYPAYEYEGTGVGLAIVQRAAERMGGQVGVESSVGHGSRFWLQFQKA